MKIIEGFAQAKVRLSRQVTGFGDVSPRIKEHLKTIFGRDISAQEAVEQIAADVRARGDEALKEYTLKIDNIQVLALEVSQDQIKEAYKAVDAKLLAALKLAAERIRQFHQAQKKLIWSGVHSSEWGQHVRPLERVGVYAPGGTAAYPSTVLMTAIPAKVAGVKQVILTTPPKANGGVPAVVLVAADIAGVDRVFSLGGVLAIAALAYGTESVPRVDKICGPGNIFVMLAKKLVFGVVGIDGLQGPSEVLIIADKKANPKYCAADLLAQAEHDAMAQCILVTTSRELADEVSQEVEGQLADLPRQAIARESIENRGLIAVVADMNEALELANLYAPEHLELMVEKADSYLKKIDNAGCVFIGKYSPVPMGDYVAGPNHALPTGGTARFSSPLNIVDFIKFIDTVKIDSGKYSELGAAAITLARAEGLEAHARAVEKRLKG